MAAEDALAAEALRVNDRYLQEVVLAFDLCPWAERSLREGHVRRRVLSATTVGTVEPMAFVDELEKDAGAEIGLLIFPRLALPANEFDRYAERVRQADRSRRKMGQMPAFVIAAFHPAGQVEYANADQLVSFIRRTPDPTFQFVRYSLLQEARDSGSDVSDNIARKNLATVTEHGAERVDAVVRDIRADRDAAYARLGV